jgi:hypothetical protein
VTRLLPPQHGHERSYLLPELCDGFVSVAKAGVELVFAKRQYMTAERESLLIMRDRLFLLALFEQGSSSTLLEGLHPQRLRYMRDGLGDSVKGRRSRIQPGCERFPPRVEERTNGIGRAPADLLANPPSRWPEPCAQERIGRLTHIRERDAAACCAIGARGLGHFRRIADVAWHIRRSEGIL